MKTAKIIICVCSIIGISLMSCTQTINVVEHSDKVVPEYLRSGWLGYALTVADDGSRYAIADEEGIRIIEGANGRLVHFIPSVLFEATEIYGMRMSATGKYLSVNLLGKTLVFEMNTLPATMMRMEHDGSVCWSSEEGTLFMFHLQLRLNDTLKSGIYEFTSKDNFSTSKLVSSVVDTEFDKNQFIHDFRYLKECNRFRIYQKYLFEYNGTYKYAQVNELNYDEVVLPTGDLWLDIERGDIEMLNNHSDLVGKILLNGIFENQNLDAMQGSRVLSVPAFGDNFGVYSEQSTNDGSSKTVSVYLFSAKTGKFLGATEAIDAPKGCVLEFAKNGKELYVLAIGSMLYKYVINEK